jgi:alcohol/geraniol dehydrogenase (NADP+)
MDGGTRRACDAFVPRTRVLYRCVVSITVWQAREPGAPLERAERPMLEPAADELVLEVLHCGLCHSDLSMLENHWGVSSFPLVPGHEVVGRVVQVGEGVAPGVIGQLRGLGWISGSCSHCGQCLSGTGNLCPSLEATIVGRQGGFASHVTARQDWAIPLPEGMDPAVAGPLFCGGITVFAPLIDEVVSPTAHVAVIGIGGLGHMALQFARAWGCEVTALTTTLAKADEAKRFGAHQVEALDNLANLAGRFDLVINTVNHSLDWAAVMASLAPRGRLHQLGAVLDPIQVGALDLIMARRSITGSPTIFTSQPAEDGGVLRAPQHPPAGGASADGSRQRRDRPFASRGRALSVCSGCARRSQRLMRCRAISEMNGIDGTTDRHPLLPFMGGSENVR